TDVIDRLVGIEEGDALFALREQRPDAKANAQASFDALFASDELGHVAQLERLAVAAWTTALAQGPTASFYRGLLADASPEIASALDAAAAGAVPTGPYG
ncbi:CMD domain protein, partial [Mesorhizobium japonicum]